MNSKGKQKISTEQFQQRFQNHRQYHDKSIDLLDKATIADKKELKDLKKYLINEDDSYYISNTIFYSEDYNFTKDIVIEYVSSIRSIIFSNCEFDCNLILNTAGVKYIIFVDCIFKKDLKMSSRIDNHFIIKNSKVEGLVFDSALFVKEDVLLTNSSFQRIDIKENFQCNNFIVNKNSVINGNFSLKTPSMGRMILEDVKIKGSFFNNGDDTSQNKQSFYLKNLSIHGQINFKKCRIHELQINNINVNQLVYINSLSGKVTINGDANFFTYISFQGNFDSIDVEETKIWGEFGISEESIVGVLNISKSSFKKNFHIKKSVVNVIDLLQNEFIYFGFEGLKSNLLKIYNSNVEQNIYLSELACKNIQIYNIKIKQSFTIISTSKISDYERTSMVIDNLFVAEHFDLTSTKFSYLELVNTIIGGFVNFGEIEIESISTNNILCAESIHIEGNSKFSNLNLYGIYTKSIYIENTSVTSNKITFYDCHFDGVKSYEMLKIEFFYENCKINSLKFEQINNPKDNIYTFIKCQITQIELSNFNNLGNLFFREIKPKPKESKNRQSRIENLELIEKELAQNFEIENNYQKYIDWQYYRVSPFIAINQSSLGKAEFTDFDFAGFDFYYSNSKITEVFISGGTLPKTIDVYGINGDESPIEYYTQKVSAYNQFKKIFDSQGDNFQSTYFQAKAAENQAKLLQKERLRQIQTKQEGASWFSKKQSWIYTTFLSHNAFERLTFWFNKMSNKHGESWVQALKFTFVVSLIFFNLFCFASGKYGLSTSFSFDDFWKIVGDYVTFLDPTQKIKEDISGAGKLMVFLGKIFTGYGIFQLVAAFRKHGKKS